MPASEAPFRTADPPHLQGWISRFDTLIAHRPRSITRDFGVARQLIQNLTNGQGRFNVQGTDRFILFGQAHLPFGSSAIQFLRWDSQTECETSIFRASDHRLVLHIPLQGEFEAIRADTRVTVQPGQAMLVAAPGASRRRWYGPCKLLNIIIQRDSLSRVLANDFHIDPSEPPEFGPPSSINLARMETMWRLIETVVCDLTSGDSQFAMPALGSQIERALMLLLLTSFPNSYSSRLVEAESHIAPYYVRRAERYVHDHAATDITPGHLAEAAGVSVRTLFNGFKAHRQTTPMRFIKSVRLNLARQLLIAARLSGAAKITDIAASVGYGNLSQFSRDYKDRYGESPIQTTHRRD